jgi:hypothetical protein
MRCKQCINVSVEIEDVPCSECKDVFGSDPNSYFVDRNGSKSMIIDKSTIEMLKAKGYKIFSPDEWEQIKNHLINTREQYKSYPTSKMIMDEIDIILKNEVE